MSEKYQIINETGSESFGRVYIAKRILDNFRTNLKFGESKPDILNKLNHKNIIKHYESIIECNFFNIVMEYLDGEIHYLFFQNKLIYFLKKTFFIFLFNLYLHFFIGIKII